MAVTMAKARLYLQRPLGVQYTGTPYNAMADESIAYATEFCNSFQQFACLLRDIALPLTVTTLAAQIASTSATVITVAANTGMFVGQLILMESELMAVTVISGVTITVTRGASGTTAATHANGTALTSRDVQLPADFNTFYKAHLQLQSVRPLAYVDVRDIDQSWGDPGTVGVPQSCTVYTSGTFASATARQNLRLNVGSTAVDTVLLRYARRMDPAGDGTNIDAPPALVYPLLNVAAAHFAQRLVGRTPFVQGLEKMAEDSLGVVTQWDRAQRAPKG